MLIFCSQLVAYCDDLDCKLSTSDDYFNEQEEELRRRVQLEAEERKLEETLEYQRRIEEETKQKHLAEQFRSTYASSVVGTAGLLSTGNLNRAQDNRESACTNSSFAILKFHCVNTLTTLRTISGRNIMDWIHLGCMH